jgi:S-DNA-T family DNA segregation ATPase FtsK/SpoIIIE
MYNTFGIEIPRKNFNEIPLSLTLKSNEFLNSHHKIPLIIGYDVNDNLIIDDLTRLPHLLVGGAIWSGKSSFLRNLITCMTSLLSPRQLQLIICDPKKIEFDYAKGYPHLLGKVINTFDDAIEQMRKLVDTMNKRTAMLASAGVRDLDDYNQKTKSPLPRLVLIVDELADLVIYSAEIEELIMQLTMKGRRVGIHLILSSQISAPHIFSPIIKANIPSRASFQVSKPSESKVLLEESGAELLSNHGDMIYSSVTIPTTRLQAPYISKEASVELAQKN